MARLLFALASLVVVLSGTAGAQTIWVPGRVVEGTPIWIQPNPARTPLKILPSGTSVTVIAIEGEWLNVAFEDGRYGRRVGYVPRPTVSFALPTAPAAAQAATRPAPTPPPAVAAAAQPVKVPAPAPPARVVATPPAAVPAAPGTMFPAPAPPPGRAAAPPRPTDPATEPLFPAPAPPHTRVFATAPPAVSATQPPLFPDATLPVSAGDVIQLSPISRTERVAEDSVRAAEPARMAVSDEPGSEAGSRIAAGVTGPASSAVSAVPALPGAAGRAPVSPKKGMPLTVMIPRAVLKDDGYVSRRKVPVMAADIDNPTGSQVLVNGQPDWMVAGLPSLLEVAVEKVSHEKDYTELELRGHDVAVRLRFAHSVVEPEATLGQLVTQGGRDTAAAVQFRNEAHAALARSLFPAELDALGDERKRSILAAFQAAAGSPDIHVHESQLYAAYDLGREGQVYNDRDFDEETILAYVLNETVLTRVRELSKSLPDVPELRGLRVLRRIPHAPEKDAPPEDYRLEIIAGAEPLAKLAGGEITNQELVDGSVILLDGRPVRIRLAAPGD